MSWFGSKSSYEEHVVTATSDVNTTENWAKIMDICDMINQKGNAEEAVRDMAKRLMHKNPNVQLQAVKLLSACVNNCGRPLHSEEALVEGVAMVAVCSHAFMKEIKTLLDPSAGNPTHPTVQKDIKGMLVEWEKSFAGDSQLAIVRNTLQELKRRGMDLADLGSSTEDSTKVTEAQRLALQEEEEMALALAASASLAEQSTMPAISQTSNARPSAMRPKSAKCLYDFEATEDNELSFVAGDVIVVTNNTDPNWWCGSDQGGKEGYFPASFVTFDLSIQVEKEVVPEQPEEPEKIVIDEDKFDQCLDALYDIMRDGAVDQLQGLSGAKAECENMMPLISKQIEVFEEAETGLKELSDRFEKAMELYQQLKTARPMPAPAAPATGMVRPGTMGSGAAPTALFGQHPSTYGHHGGVTASRAPPPTSSYHGSLPPSHAPSQQQQQGYGGAPAQPPQQRYTAQQQQYNGSQAQQQQWSQQQHPQQHARPPPQHQQQLPPQQHPHQQRPPPQQQQLPHQQQPPPQPQQQPSQQRSLPPYSEHSQPTRNPQGQQLPADLFSAGGYNRNPQQSQHSHQQSAQQPQQHNHHQPSYPAQQQQTQSPRPQQQQPPYEQQQRQGYGGGGAAGPVPAHQIMHQQQQQQRPQQDYTGGPPQQAPPPQSGGFVAPGQFQ